MKIIPINVATTASATSAHASWPATNVLDPILKKCWKAATSSVASATLTVSSAGQQDSIAVMGIVADTITVTVSDPNSTTWEAGTFWETGTAWAAITPTTATTLVATDLTDSGAYAIGGQTGMALFEFDEFVSSVSIAITVQNTTGRPMTLSVGAVVVGKYIEFPIPNYGLRVNMVDYSIERELANGAMYYKPRDLVREFDITLQIIDKDEYDVLWQIYRMYRRVPMPVVVVDNFGAQWLIMGRLKSLSSTFETYNGIPTSMTIREEI